MQKKNKTKKIYLKQILIWYLIIIMNIVIVYALPLTSSLFSISKILMSYIPLSIIGAISLNVALKKSFKKNIIYVYALFILLAATPILSILTNIVSIELNKSDINYFEPYEFRCNMHHKEKDFYKWWELNSYWYMRFNITKEMFEKFPLKNGFSSEILFLSGKNATTDKINIGDIVVYKLGDNKSVAVNRVIRKEYENNFSYIMLSGDNNRVYYQAVPQDYVLGILEETIRTKIFGFIAKDGCGNFTGIG